MILPERSYTSIEVYPGSESSNEMDAEEQKGFGLAHRLSGEEGSGPIPVSVTVKLTVSAATAMPSPKAVTIPHKATVSSWFLLSHSKHMMMPNPHIQFIRHGKVSNNPDLSRMHLWLFTR